MKTNKIICATLLLITTHSFAYEYYDYSGSDDNYSSYNDNYDNGYDTSYADNRDDSQSYNYSSSGFKKYSANRKEFVGKGKTFVFDPKELTWAAYYNGTLINSGRASGGRHYCPDIGKPCKTPVGVFYVGRMGGPDCKSTKYPIGRGNAPMPYCMFFKGGFAIHGSWAVPNYNASHGCIRVHPMEARWLNQVFMNPGTRVVVKSYN